MHNRSPSFIAFASGLLIALILTAYLYSFGLNAGIQFDDRSNLSGLEKISDGQSIWGYVFGGNAGELGRPLSLFTFALQSHSWPKSPADFTYVNIALHLLNGCLVVWLALMLVPNKTKETGIYQALLAGATWLLMPLLVSSSLMIVQRMATLVATAVLTGLIAYVKYRQYFEKTAKFGMIGLTVILIAFTSLAALIKENGVLFPGYCLAVEILLMAKAPYAETSKAWRLWKGAFLGLPLLGIIIFLAVRIDYSQATVFMRGFDGVDRLLFQSQTLFQYLFRAFLPRPAALGPFHDQLNVVPSLWFYALSTIASSAWLLLITIGIKLKDRYPELLFALTWYLGGHLLESTTIALELYFEHRNYIPIIGPIIALTIYIFRLYRPSRKWIFIFISALYLTISATGLLVQTTLWGNRLVAANVWEQYNPTSIRALIHLSNVMRERGEYTQVPRMLANYLETNRDPRVKFMRLLTLCSLKIKINDADKTLNYDRIPNKTAFALSMSSTYEKLYAVHKGTRCPGLSDGDVYLLGAKLLSVPEVNSSYIAVHNINSVLTVQSIAAGDFWSARKNIYAALNANFYLDSFDVALKIADHMADDAMKKDLWAKVHNYRPRHPVKRKIWDDWLTKIKEAHPNDHESNG